MAQPPRFIVALDLEDDAEDPADVTGRRSGCERQGDMEAPRDDAPLVSVPTRLDAWTYDAVLRLLEAHAFEDARFDWKRDLKGDVGTVTKAAVAMANTGGGFLVFGVADGRSGDARERIVGVDLTRDFAKELSDNLGRADPSVPFVLGPPVRIPERDGTGLLVAEILSLSAPHSFDGRFLRRVPGSTEVMGTEEVRNMFRRREDVLAKARLLLLELAAAREAAMLPETSYDYSKKLPYRLIATATLAQLTADLADLLSVDPSLASALVAFRGKAENFNLLFLALDPIKSARGQSSVREFPMGAVLVELSSPGRMLATEATGLIKRLSDAFAIQPPELRKREDLQADT